MRIGFNDERDDQFCVICRSLFFPINDTDALVLRNVLEISYSFHAVDILPDQYLLRICFLLPASPLFTYLLEFDQQC